MKLINTEVRIENTNACNARCSICNHSKMTRNTETMSNTRFVHILNQIIPMGAETVSIFGFGEPLIDQGIVWKVNYARYRGLKTFITTNASLLHTQLGSELLGAGLSHLRFSVHGLFSKDYEQVHNGLSFIETIRNIFNFIIINRKRFDGRCKVSATVIPMAGESVDDIRRFWEPHVNWLEVWRPHNWATAKSFRRVLAKEARLSTCGRPFRGPVQIQSNGDVIPCCFLTDGEVILGNVFKEKLEDILVGDAYEKLRHAHASGELDDYPCKSCDQLNIEEESPLLYSNRDKNMKIGCTSSTKFCVTCE